LYIVDGDEYGLFRLDNNGRLYIENVPHARTETEYLLTILAFDGKHDRKAHVKVKLRVDSAVVNCSEEQLEISVKEDAKEGTVLLGRREEKLISSVHFTLISDVEIDNFAVTKTGDLIL
uniref:Cadherin domain-containing protein n=1 Tax=Anisakis simplex TaxID=6269 RepID=A0A0M3JBJ2_ANISI